MDFPITACWGFLNTDRHQVHKLQCQKAETPENRASLGRTSAAVMGPSSGR